MTLNVKILPKMFTKGLIYVKKKKKDLKSSSFWSIVIELHFKIVLINSQRTSYNLKVDVITSIAFYFV